MKTDEYLNILVGNFVKRLIKPHQTFTSQMTINRTKILQICFCFTLSTAEKATKTALR